MLAVHCDDQSVPPPPTHTHKKTSKLELLGTKWAMSEKFRNDLLGADVEIYTDKRVLTF